MGNKRRAVTDGRFRLGIRSVGRDAFWKNGNAYLEYMAFLFMDIQNATMTFMDMGNFHFQSSLTSQWLGLPREVFLKA